MADKIYYCPSATFLSQVFYHRSQEMAFISGTTFDSPRFGQGERPPSLPHLTVEEMPDWISSALTVRPHPVDMQTLVG